MTLEDSIPIPGNGDETVDSLTIEDAEALYARGTNGSFEEPYLFEDYGDPGATLQAVHDDMAPLAGKIIFPYGELNFGTQPVLTANGLVLEGVGSNGQSIQNPRTDGTPLLTLDGAIRAVLRDFRFQGSADSLVGETGIEITNTSGTCRGITLDNVNVEATGGTAIDVIETAAANEGTFQITLRDCRVGAIESGYGVHFGPNSSQNTIRGGYYEITNGNYCILDEGSELELADVTVGNAQYYAVDLRGVQGSVSGTLQVENGVTGSDGGVRFAGAAHNWSVDHIRAVQNDDRGVYIDGEDISIRRLTLGGNGGRDVEIGQNAERVKIGAIREVNDSPLIYVNPEAIDIDAPFVDNYNGLTDGGADDEDSTTGQITKTLDVQYSERPEVSFGRTAGGLNGVTFNDTDSDGNYEEIVVDVTTAGGTIDMFLSPSVI